MSYFEEVIKDIDKGKAGLSQGLDFGFPKLMEKVPGIQKSTYYVVAGETSSGKSAFALNSFLYNPFTLLKASGNPREVKLKIFLWSLEIPKRDILAKALARKLYFQQGYLVDVNFILSKGKARITEEVYQDAIKLADFYQELESIVNIIPSENPTGVYNTLYKYMETRGKTYNTTINIGTSEEPKTIEVFDKYEPYDENEHVIVIIDHVALLKKERGFDNKQLLDKMSEYLVILRNRFGITPIVVSQLNRTNSSTDRMKMKMTDPILSDLKGTGVIAEDANVIFSLFSPFRYDIEEHFDYDITKLRDRYRNLSVLKNRDGEASLNMGMLFLGEAGIFSSLPTPAILKLQGYETYTEINKIENFIEDE